MSLTLKITKIPHLNVVVIKQEGGHFFISTANSIVIDKEGFLQLIAGLVKLDFIVKEDILRMIGDESENKENSDSPDIREGGSREKYGLNYAESSDGETVSRIDST